MLESKMFSISATSNSLAKKWSLWSACAALGRCRQNVVATINGVFTLHPSDLDTFLQDGFVLRFLNFAPLKKISWARTSNLGGGAYICDVVTKFVRSRRCEDPCQAFIAGERGPPSVRPDIEITQTSIISEINNIISTTEIIGFWSILHCFCSDMAWSQVDFNHITNYTWKLPLAKKYGPT